MLTLSAFGAKHHTILRGHLDRPDDRQYAAQFYCAELARGAVLPVCRENGRVFSGYDDAGDWSGVRLGTMGALMPWLPTIQPIGR